jgi:hypothetical protein
MATQPKAQEIRAAVTRHQKAASDITAIRQALQVSPAAHEAVFSPQPYPLFLADWSQDKPLVGRIIGWSTEPGSIPRPVVVFEDGGHSCVPLLVDMVLGMGGSGPMWIRDSAAEALAAANAHVAPQHRGTL